MTTVPTQWWARGSAQIAFRRGHPQISDVAERCSALPATTPSAPRRSPALGSSTARPPPETPNASPRRSPQPPKKPVSSTNTLAGRASAAPPPGSSSAHVRGPAKPGRPALRRTSANGPGTVDQRAGHRRELDGHRDEVSARPRAYREAPTCNRPHSTVSGVDGIKDLSDGAGACGIRTLPTARTSERDGAAQSILYTSDSVLRRRFRCDPAISTGHWSHPVSLLKL